MKNVLNFQPATTTSIGIFRLPLVALCCFVFILISFTANAQSNQHRDFNSDVLETLIFPNPVSVQGEVRIVVPQNAIIEIVTIDGINLLKFLPNPEAEEVTWDLTTPKGETVAPGMYFVVVSDEEGGRNVSKLSVIE